MENRSPVPSVPYTLGYEGQKKKNSIRSTFMSHTHGEPRITEGYHCNYGLNREYELLLFGGSLRPTAHDLSGEVRAVELSGHPFFVATLFQPERAALRGEVPPLVASFVAALQ
jgi:CTP synthase (UTP-ammonia lyase)